MSYRISKEFDAQRSLKVQQCIIVQVHAPASIPHAARRVSKNVPALPPFMLGLVWVSILTYQSLTVAPTPLRGLGFIFPIIYFEGGAHPRPFTRPTRGKPRARFLRGARTLDYSRATSGGDLPRSSGHSSAVVRKGISWFRRWF